MNAVSDRERIVELEITQRHLLEALTATKEELQRVNTQVSQLNRHFTRWGAFIAGAMLSVSLIWALVIGGWQAVQHFVVKG